MFVDIGREMQICDRALVHQGEKKQHRHIFHDWPTSRPQYEQSMRQLVSAFLGRKIAEIPRIPFTSEQLAAFREYVCEHLGYSPDSYVLFWIPEGVGVENLVSRGLHFPAGSQLLEEIEESKLRTSGKWVLAAPLSPIEKIGRGGNQTLKYLREFSQRLRVPPGAISMGTFLDVAFLMLFQWRELGSKLTDSGILYTRTGSKGRRITLGPWRSNELAVGEIREKSTDTSLNTLLIVQS